MTGNRMLVKSLLLILLMGTAVMSGDQDDWLTFYEKSNFRETPRYAETLAYCRKLADYSDWVKITDFGMSPQGRKLPLVIADNSGNFTSEKVKASNKAIVFIQAGIHSGEIDGKDAGLMLLRDMVVTKKLSHLLDRVTLLFVPIFNVDGHERFGPYNRINQNGPEEMGWRVTAQGFNLNRDFLKADSPEMQAWLKLFNKWLPDFLVDCHVTDGADYQYPVTYSVATDKSVAKPLSKFSEERLEPFLKRRMEEDHILMNFYVSFKNWGDPTSGLRVGNLSPRYSTGFGAVQNRIFYLIETHMLKDYHTRVTATYHLLKNILQFANRFHDDLMETNAQADRLTAQDMTGTNYPLRFSFSPRDSVMVNFLGYEFEYLPSDISDGKRLIYHPEKPKIYRLPYFNKMVATDSARVPYAYIIPAEWQFQIEKLKLHNAILYRLTKDTTIQVESYRFKNVTWAQRPFEGHHLVQFETEPVVEKRNYLKGSVVVFLNQRINRLLLHLLEPRGPDSFVSWGFWDTIFEQKEYAENYVLEEMAPKMLKNNPELEKEFREKIASDSLFAASAYQRLKFFYKRSLYWDKKMNLYPVGKIMEKILLPIEKN